MQMFKVAAVSYLNTYPFLYGLQRSGIRAQVDLTLTPPARCADLLQQGEIDIALLPIAVVPYLPEAHIITDTCIAAEGPVKTVGLFGQQPVEQLRHVYLDYESRTSVQLIRVLFKHYWQQKVDFLKGQPGYEKKIKNKAGGLIIGDRVICWKERFEFEYDLAEAWQQWTGLPFVFACWVSREKLPWQFLSQFSAALKTGLKDYEQVRNAFEPEIESKLHNDFDIIHYWEKHISYLLDEQKQAAMRKFWSLTAQLPAVTTIPEEG